MSLQTPNGVFGFGNVFQMAAFRHTEAQAVLPQAGEPLSSQSTFQREGDRPLARILGEGRWDRRHESIGWSRRGEIDAWWQETYALVSDLRRDAAPDIREELGKRLAFLAPRLSDPIPDWSLHLIVLASLMVQDLSYQPLTDSLVAQACQTAGAAKPFLNGDYGERLRATLVLQRLLPSLPIALQMRTIQEVARSHRALLTYQDAEDSVASLEAYQTFVPWLGRLPALQRNAEIATASLFVKDVALRGESETVRSLARKVLGELLNF